jgi:hypothetical protein
MKLPADAIIAAEKVTRYLLVSQTRGDKSAFLARGGYTIENADQLLHDLRSSWMKENVSGVTKFITLIPEK